MGPGSSNNHRAPVRNSDRPISFTFKSYSIHSVITTTSKFILVISKFDCLFSGLSSSRHIFLLSRIDGYHMIVRIRTTDAWGGFVLHKMEVIVLPAMFAVRQSVFITYSFGLLLTQYGFHHRRSCFKRVPEFPTPRTRCCLRWSNCRYWTSHSEAAFQACHRTSSLYDRPLQSQGRYFT